MLRAIVLGVALAAVVAACALLPAEPPADTRPVQITVHNSTGVPVEVRVIMAGGAGAGSAEPAVVPTAPLGTPVIIHVPLSGDWGLQLGTQVTISRRDF